MSIIKKPYEISIWEDIVVYSGIVKINAGNITLTQFLEDPSKYYYYLSGEDKYINCTADDWNSQRAYYYCDDSNVATTNTKFLYYAELRLATIGSDTMTSPARAVNPVFKKNINGVYTLTFDMYYQYEDVEAGEIVHNPLIDYIVDERKVKLKYDGQWYDFIVKKDDEKGRDYKYSFTCTSLAANELGKTGFNIELDAELGNNIGTVKELAEKVLEGSDWGVSSETETILLTIDEALYFFKTKSLITAKIRGTDTNETIDANSYIYVYYTSFINKEEDYFLFIYVDRNKGAATPDLLEDKVTINCTNKSGETYDLYLSNVTWVGDYPNFVVEPTDSYVSLYRGRRYIKKLAMTYDPVLERAVYKYKGKNNNNTYYGYTTTEYIGAATVTNYIYNSSNFTGTSYWGMYGSNTGKTVSAQVYPKVNTKINNNYSSYLVFNFGTYDINYSATRSRLMNEGIILNYSRINNFKVGEKYRLKVKIGYQSNGNIDFFLKSNLPFDCIVKKYNLVSEDNKDTNDIIYFNSTNSSTILTNGEDSYVYIDMVCLNSATWNELKSNVGIFFYPKDRNNYNKNYYIKDILFYIYLLQPVYILTKVTEDEFNNNKTSYYYYDGTEYIQCKPESVYNRSTDYYIRRNILEPGDVPEARIKTVYHFYDPNDSQNKNAISEDDYKFSDSNPDNYTPVYGGANDEFEKTRGITAKESNRFNLLQELSETFECWVRFDIAHEDNGLISFEIFNHYKLVNLQVGTSTIGYYVYDWDKKKYVASTGNAIKGKKYYAKEPRKRQDKKVKFYSNILEDNNIGFKYGINLKDNNRTLDSEQIVTKIIVKDNNCELAENGFCSIARAKDNPIKENFAYNFDYYISLGLVNGINLNTDLYLNFNGSVGLYPRLSKLNKERNSLIDSSAAIANSISELSSKYLVASLQYNEADKEYLRITDARSGTIYQYTHYVYDDFFNLLERTQDSSGYVPAYKNEIYYISGDGVTDITPNAGTLTYYKMTTDTEPLTGHTYYYLDGNKFTKFESKKFRDTATYYEVSSLNNNGNNNGLYFLTSNTVTKLKFTYTSISKVLSFNFEKGGIDSSTGNNFTANDRLRSVGYFSVRPGEVYSVNIVSSSGTIGYVYKWFYDKNKKYLNTHESASYFTIPEKAYYMRISIVTTSEPSLISNSLIANVTPTAVYIYNAARRTFALGDEDFINDNFTISTLAKVITTLEAKEKALAEMDKIKPDLDNTLAEYDSIKDKLKEIALATESVEAEFNTKYSRYIQEGSWTDDNYMDDDLYYLDALSVLYLSAYPKVSYNFGVIELSLLEGYESFKFDIGQKTYVEDTEFFGYRIIDSLKTPVQETVVVTEATLYLDENDKNLLKVLNYKSHFEDLFQRITAATQSLEFHSGEYARAANAVSPTGVINLSILLKTLNAANYVITNSHDLSIVWDETGLLATNLADPLQIVRLTSAGILVSADGGNNWGVAITGQGINTNLLTAGIIDADNINIMSGEFPTFRWDSKGLRAYGYTANENTGAIESLDPSKFVNYDKFGIYGINGLTDPDFKNLSDVEKNAVFALTWNGLFMRSLKRNGYVRISPTEDIVLKEYNSAGNEITRGKFGVISGEGTNNEIYGLALYDPDGVVSFLSKSDGSLWLSTKIEIGIPDRTAEIYLGVGEESPIEEQIYIYEKTKHQTVDPLHLPDDFDEIAKHGKKVIRVHGNEWEDDTGAKSGGTSLVDRFAVYEDGFVIDNGNLHNGPINAPSGTIGGLSIAALPETIGIRINPKTSDTFKIDSEGNVSPEILVFDWTSAGLPTGIRWYASTDTTSWQEITAISETAAQSLSGNNWKKAWVETIDGHKCLKMKYMEDKFNNGLIYIKIECLIAGKSGRDLLPIKLSRDGAPNYSFDLISSLGNVIKTGTASTETLLVPYVYKNGEDISDNYIYTWYWKTENMTNYLPIKLGSLPSGGGTDPDLDGYILEDPPTGTKEKLRYIALYTLRWTNAAIYFSVNENYLLLSRDFSNNGIDTAPDNFGNLFASKNRLSSQKIAVLPNVTYRVKAILNNGSNITSGAVAMYNKDGSMISKPFEGNLMNSGNNFTNTYIINSESTEIKYIRVAFINGQAWNSTDSTKYIEPSDIKSVEITEVLN